MKRFAPAWTLAAACVFAVAVSAQDTTVKSKTKIEADDANVVTMKGCLQQAGNVFLLSGATMVKGDDMKSKSKTKIDQDENETEVKERSKTEVEHDQPVGTSGAVAAYVLTPSEGVNLMQHVGHTVEVTALTVDRAKGGDDDAKVDTRTETKVKTEDAPDAKVKSKTEAEIPRGPNNKLSVMSIKDISPSCPL